MPTAITGGIPSSGGGKAPRRWGAGPLESHSRSRSRAQGLVSFSPDSSSGSFPAQGEVGSRPGHSLPTQASAVALDCCPSLVPMRARGGPGQPPSTAPFHKGPCPPAGVCNEGCPLQATAHRDSVSYSAFPFPSLLAAPGLNNSKPFDRNLPLFIFSMPFLKIKV